MKVNMEVFHISLLGNVEAFRSFSPVRQEQRMMVVGANMMLLSQELELTTKLVDPAWWVNYICQVNLRMSSDSPVHRWTELTEAFSVASLGNTRVRKPHLGMAAILGNLYLCRYLHVVSTDDFGWSESSWIKYRHLQTCLESNGGNITLGMGIYKVYVC